MNLIFIDNSFLTGEMGMKEKMAKNAIASTSSYYGVKIYTKNLMEKKEPISIVYDSDCPLKNDTKNLLLFNAKKYGYSVEWIDVNHFK